MPEYYVNQVVQSDGNHEVHKLGCGSLGRARYTTFLGDYTHCAPALEAAKTLYKNVNGCRECSPQCLNER